MEENQFEQFNLSSEMIETLTLLGYTTPTPIQMVAIPKLLDGLDVVGRSQTGSGKTAAFGIPICDQILWDENAPQALILEPTRELAVQVKDELFQIGRKRKIKIPAVFGGMAIDKEITSLKQKAHIVVGTPGRLLDHIRRGTLNLDMLKYLVIDEADLMLDMGFLDDVELLINATPYKHLTMALFSATLDDHINNLVKRYMKQPQIIEIESKTKAAEGITQRGYYLENEDKFKALMDILTVEQPDDCMIFCDTREMVNSLYQQLKRKKIHCGMLHGGMEQKDRLYTIQDFRAGKFHYLVTTDVAARGIDFDNMTLVINYDFPTKKAYYVHRIGRTGRNGKTGTAITFVQQSERHYLRTVEEYIGVEIPMEELPNASEVRESREAFLAKNKKHTPLKEQRGAVFHTSITKLRIAGGKKSKMRAGDIVGTLCSIEGITQEDIGIVDVRDSVTFVEIFNAKGDMVYEALQNKTIKGKMRKVEKMRS